MRWAASFAVNRLLLVAVVALVLTKAFHIPVGVDYVERVDRWLGFDDLVRAFERGR